MDHASLIEALNKAVALEHTACIQYKQHALLVRGIWRKVYADFFLAESLASHDHAHKFGQKIVALGGEPTSEIGSPVQQALELRDMLQQDLELERQAKQAYLNALDLCGDDVALRNMLEDQIETEQHDIDELELALEMVEAAAVTPERQFKAV